MGMINFEDAPTGISSIAAAGATAAKARSQVLKAWRKWLPGLPASWPSAQAIPIADADLTNSLVEDNKLRVPYAACRKLVEAFTETNGSHHRVRARIELASPRLKAFASELVAIASTIHVAQTKGLVFIGNRNDVNTYFLSKKTSPPVWSIRWRGFGPDYLFSDAVGNATFVEVKGEVFARESTPSKKRLKAFVEKKVQSMNASLSLPKSFPPPPSIRHVLSRVRRDKNHAISVRWFNERQPPDEHTEEDREPCDPLVLAVALSNFHQILRSLSATHDLKSLLARLSEGPADGIITAETLSPASRRLVEVDRSEFDGGDAHRRTRIFVPRRVVEIFESVEGWFSAWRRQQQLDQSSYGAGFAAEARQLNAELQRVVAQPYDDLPLEVRRALERPEPPAPDRLPFGIVAWEESARDSNDESE